MLSHSLLDGWDCVGLVGLIPESHHTLVGSWRLGLWDWSRVPLCRAWRGLHLDPAVIGRQPPLSYNPLS
jgi:hypothetical protein